jgi:hypothetical protein
MEEMIDEGDDPPLSGSMIQIASDSHSTVCLL